MWSCYKEHRADALALRADERRDKLRKAAGRSKYPLSRGCLNGGTRGTETSKYPEEEKETSISGVAASEMERAQTGVRAHRGYGLH